MDLRDEAQGLIDAHRNVEWRDSQTRVVVPGTGVHLFTRFAEALGYLSHLVSAHNHQLPSPDYWVRQRNEGVNPVNLRRLVSEANHSMVLLEMAHQQDPDGG